MTGLPFGAPPWRRTVPKTVGDLDDGPEVIPADPEEVYAKSRDEAAYRKIADSMNRRLHGGRSNPPQTQADYDVHSW